MTATPADLRQQPGVCPHLRETFHNPLTCMYCVPTNVRHCCRKHETEDLKGSIFGRNFIVCPTCQDKRCAHADDCANDCTGQQPAQPESVERLLQPVMQMRSTPTADNPYDFVMEPVPLIPATKGVYVLACDYDRLQSALTEAQRENAALRNLAANLQPGPISEALSGQRYTTETELRDQLTAAQQKIGYCMDLFDQHGGFDKAAPLEALVRSALSTIKSLKTERGDLQRRLEDGLDAWRKNNAHHAAEIDRLKREVERLSGEQEPPHCRSCRCGRGICGGSS